MQLKNSIAALIATGILALSTQAFSQDLNYKQADDFADWLVADGQYGKAAGLYAEAFTERARTVYAYKAADLYFYVKDYAKASKFFEAAAKSSDFPDATLKYARALKMMGKYEEATTQYTNFATAYAGADSTEVRRKVKVEKQGVQLAIAERTRVDPTIFVDPVSPMINGMKNEIAPMIMADGSLVFISDFDGTMRAYSSERSGNNWTQMRPAPQFPVLEEGHIGGGTLVSKDRFVFSLCPQTELMSQPAVKCTIQEVTRRGGTWGAPKPIGGNINVEGSSSLAPFIFEEDGKEIMIFASDRANGFGGMDLWKAERAIGSDLAVFSAPVNLGPEINTAGNEVTPYFDTETRVLSYSTNGAVTLGGYDVYHATATQGVDGWKTPINPGTPVNSTGDDYHYRMVSGTSTAYLASNRAMDMTRTNMVNDDLYTVTYDNKNIMVEVMVIDDATGEPVSDPTMTVSLNPDGLMLKPLIVRRSLDGYFSFALPVDREVTIDISRPYFNEANLDIRIPATEKDGFAVKPMRIVRTPVGKDDIEVVARTRRPGSSTSPVKNDIMTATTEGADEAGDKTEGN